MNTVWETWRADGAIEFLTQCSKYKNIRDAYFNQLVSPEFQRASNTVEKLLYILGEKEKFTWQCSMCLPAIKWGTEADPSFPITIVINSLCPFFILIRWKCIIVYLFIYLYFIFYSPVCLCNIFIALATLWNLCIHANRDHLNWTEREIIDVIPYRQTDRL